MHIGNLVSEFWSADFCRHEALSYYNNVSFVNPISFHGVDAPISVADERANLPFGVEFLCVI